MKPLDFTPQLQVVVAEMAASCHKRWFYKTEISLPELTQLAFEHFLKNTAVKITVHVKDEDHLRAVVALWTKRHLRHLFLRHAQKQASGALIETIGGEALEVLSEGQVTPANGADKRLYIHGSVRNPLANEPGAPVPERDSLLYENLSVFRRPGQRAIIKEILSGAHVGVHRRHGNLNVKRVKEKIKLLYPTAEALSSDVPVWKPTDGVVARDLILLLLMRGDYTATQMHAWLGYRPPWIVFDNDYIGMRGGSASSRKRKHYITAAGFDYLASLVTDEDYSRFLYRQAKHRDHTVVEREAARRAANKKKSADGTRAYFAARKEARQ
jgi:hypothetical protein